MANKVSNKVIWKKERNGFKMSVEIIDGYCVLLVLNQYGHDHHILDNQIDIKWEAWNLTNCYKITFNEEYDMNFYLNIRKIFKAAGYSDSEINEVVA